MNEKKDNNNRFLFRSVLVDFVTFVFLCIALTHSASDAVYGPCGRTLRDLLVALVVSVVVGSFACVLLEVIHKNADGTIEFAAGAALCVFLLAFVCMLLVLGWYTLMASVESFRSPQCVKAMTDAGAGTGVPLLGIVGLAQGLRCVCLGAELCLFVLLAVAGVLLGVCFGW